MLIDTDKPDRIRLTQKEIEDLSEVGLILNRVRSKKALSQVLVDWIHATKKSQPDFLTALANKLISKNPQDPR